MNKLLLISITAALTASVASAATIVTPVSATASDEVSSASNTINGSGLFTDALLPLRITRLPVYTIEMTPTLTIFLTYTRGLGVQQATLIPNGLSLISVLNTSYQEHMFGKPLLGMKDAN